MDQLIQADSVLTWHLLQIGQLQQAVHHAGKPVHLPLQNRQKFLCGLRGEIVFFSEEADSGFKNGQRGTELMGGVL